MCISKEPWINFLWNAKGKTMVMKYKSKIYHMLVFLCKKDLLTKKEKETLVKSFAEANDYDIKISKAKLNEMQSIL